MKKIIWCFILCLMISNCYVFGQKPLNAKISVIPEDPSARNYEKCTDSDELCALVIVETDISGIQFDSKKGIEAIVKLEDGFRLYVAPGETVIHLLAYGYSFVEVALPEPAREALVYRMVLSAEADPFEISAMEKVTFRMNESNVYIQRGEHSPVLSASSTAVFYVQSGEKKYRFIKEGFMESEIFADASQDAMVDVLLIPGRESLELKESIEVVIDSEPVDAEVILNGQFIGNTPYHGRQLAGKYELVLNKAGYYIHRSEINIDDDGAISHPKIYMDPLSGFWRLNSRPVGAEVYLNDVFIGRSPIKRSRLGEGVYDLRVISPLYHDHKEQFTISHADELDFQVSLDEAFGTVTVKSDDLSDFKNTLSGNLIRLRSGKISFGISALAAAGTAAYFHYSSNQLATEYPLATHDAGMIYDRMERHQLISYIAYGVFVPTCVMAIVRSSQQKQIERQLRLSAIPVRNGAMVGLAFSF